MRVWGRKSVDACMIHYGQLCDQDGVEFGGCIDWVMMKLVLQGKRDLLKRESSLLSTKFYDLELTAKLFSLSNSKSSGVSVVSRGMVCVSSIGSSSNSSSLAVRSPPLFSMS